MLSSHFKNHDWEVYLICSEHSGSLPTLVYPTSVCTDSSLLVGFSPSNFDLQCPNVGHCMVGWSSTDSSPENRQSFGNDSWVLSVTGKSTCQNFQENQGAVQITAPWENNRMFTRAVKFRFSQEKQRMQGSFTRSNSLAQQFVQATTESREDGFHDTVCMVQKASRVKRFNLFGRYNILILKLCHLTYPAIGLLQQTLQTLHILIYKARTKFVPFFVY